MSVWGMLEECVGQLDEPFRRSEVIGWFRRHYPLVKESTVGAHLYAATANATNRAENHPYLGTRPALVRRVDHGLYVRAGTGAGSGAVPGSSALRGAPEALRPRARGADRARPSVEALIAGFAGHVARFGASGTFSGPSIYFHQRALEQRRAHATVAELLADTRFLEYVYAVLPAWGMHRMGPQHAKVSDFDRLVSGLRSSAADLERLWPLSITSLDPAIIPDVSSRAWRVISRIQASTSRTQIVAGSKVLHHVLPDLIPPIDRQYTFRFFTGQKSVPAGDQAAFSEWFPYLAEIGHRCQQEIDNAVNGGGPMNLGRAKVIDNAIIGYMTDQDMPPTEPLRL